MSAKARRLKEIEEQTRRHFLKSCSMGLGGLALSSLMGSCGNSQPGYNVNVDLGKNALSPRSPHFPAKVKNVIYLHMAGAPSQLE